MQRCCQAPSQSTLRNMCYQCGVKPVQKDGVCLRCKLLTVGVTGMQRLKEQRELGMTEADFRKDIYDNARKQGRDIRKAGVTSPTSGPL